MDDLSAARLQMAGSLAFHMFFAAAGVAMPLLMVVAEGLWLRTGRAVYLQLARKWAKATGILFAIGAVSGTALSFELGLLWPRFMAFAGGVVGPAFALEGYAFFLEAIFLGLYLYGWERLSPRAHWLCGLPVVVAGAASSVLVTAANAWMQAPGGYVVEGSRAFLTDPWAALFTPTWAVMAVHSTLACYAATGFAAAGVYAAGLWRGRRDAYHRTGLALCMAMATVAAVLLPITGHTSAVSVAHRQPAKLAAMEAQFRTEAEAPLRIGGWPDVARQEVRYAIELPGLLSWLVYEDTRAVVRGLDQIPRSDWPNVPLTHVAFQVMVLAGSAMVGLSFWYWVWRWRQRPAAGQRATPATPPGPPAAPSQAGPPAEPRGPFPGRALLLGLILGSPLGYLALQAGWIVTEVGRQPWIIYGVMRTAEAVTPAGGVVWTLAGFSALYLALTLTLVWLLRRLATGAPRGEPPAEETGSGGDDPLRAVRLREEGAGQSLSDLSVPAPSR